MSAHSAPTHTDTIDEVSEIQQLREDLHAANERASRAHLALTEYQTQLVTSLTHDLKNPLTTVLGRVEMLKRLTQRAEIAPSDLERHLASLEEAVKRMQQLLQTASQNDGKYAPPS